MKTDITPYAYTPYTTPITRHTLPDGTVEYRHTDNDKPVKVEMEDLFDLIIYTHEYIHSMLDLLPERDYCRIGYIITALLQNIHGTMDEARHFINEAGFEIEVTTIRRNSFFGRDGAVVDAIVREVNHA